MNDWILIKLIGHLKENLTDSSGRIYSFLICIKNLWASFGTETFKDFDYTAFYSLLRIYIYVRNKKTFFKMAMNKFHHQSTNTSQRDSSSREIDRQRNRHILRMRDLGEICSLSLHYDNSNQFFGLFAIPWR